MPVPDIGRRSAKRLVTVGLATYVGGWLIVIIILVLGVAFDLPLKPVAASMITLWLLGAMILAVIMGRRIRADRERAKRGADQAPDRGDKP